MMLFSEISALMSGLIGLYTAILFFSTVLLVIRELRFGKKSSSLFLVPLAVVLYFIFQFICNIKKPNEYSYNVNKWFGSIPVFLILLLFVAITLFHILLFMKNRKWNRTHITGVSIKEAIDNLPAGICCFEESGRIVLKNKSMEKLCHQVSGKPLLNAKQFLQVIDDKKSVLEGSDILILNEDTVYTLTSQLLTSNNTEVMLFMATDISEQYKKTQILKKRQQTVIELNKKLIDYSREIVSSITAKEILNAKIGLHDALGSNLLSAKNYILNGGTDEELNKIIDGFKRNIEFLRHKAKPPITDELEIIMQTAKQLNIRINIVGTLPEDKTLKHILVTGIHECLTNTLRHAHGNELTLNLCQSEEKIVATYTNNGISPMAK